MVNSDAISYPNGPICSEPADMKGKIINELRLPDIQCGKYDYHVLCID
jgi:hypothetical protein